MKLLLSLTLDKPIECNNLCGKIQAALNQYVSQASLDNKLISIYITDINDGAIVQKQLLIENKW